MQRHPKIHFKDILKAIEKIERYVERLIFEESSTNELVQDATVRNLEIKNLEEIFKTSAINHHLEPIMKILFSASFLIRI